jgi:hypothetical protein
MNPGKLFKKSNEFFFSLFEKRGISLNCILRLGACVICFSLFSPLLRRGGRGGGGVSLIVTMLFVSR